MLLRFLAHADRNEHAANILSLLTPGPLAQDARVLGIKVSTLGMNPGRLFPLSPMALRSSMTTERHHLVHGWMYHGNLAASIASAASRKKTPVIWSIHHSLHDLSNEKPMTARLIKILARISRSAEAISYCSNVAARQHELLGFCSERSVVIPNGVDCKEFAPDANAKLALARLIGAPDNRLLIGNFARFHPMKDQVRLVDAIADLTLRGHDVQALFVGAGHDNGVLRRRSRELNIEDRVTILPERKDIARIAPGLDLFVMTSSWGESFSLAAAEAMACGVPAVVTDVGDCAWVVGDGSFVARPGDTLSISAAIERLLALTPDERRAVGMRARARIEANFGIADYVNKHHALYAQALEKRASNAKSSAAASISTRLAGEF